MRRRVGWAGVFWRPGWCESSSARWRSVIFRHCLCLAFAFVRLSFYRAVWFPSRRERRCKRPDSIVKAVVVAPRPCARRCTIVCNSFVYSVSLSTYNKIDETWRGVTMGVTSNLIRTRSVRVHRSVSSAQCVTVSSATQWSHMPRE